MKLRPLHTLILAALLAAASVASYGPAPEHQALAGLLTGTLIFLLAKTSLTAVRRSVDRAR